MIERWECPICGVKFKQPGAEPPKEGIYIMSGTFYPQDHTQAIIDHLAMHIDQLVIAVNKQ